MMIATGQPSAYFPLKINRSQSKDTNSVVPIKFPSTRNVLWESRPVGDFETLALVLDKNVVQLFIVEKSLRLAHRYAEDRRLTSFLLGSVYPKSGDSGICFGVDRFDPGREITEKIGENVTKSKVPTAVVPGDHIIPITVKQELLTSDDSISHTKDEFTRAVQVMEAKICGKDVLTLSHVVSLKANLYCCRKQDELIISLHCGAIVPNLKFQARPIAPLSIIPTTLARNLAGPLRLSDVEGTPKMGYVTMDETRKLLLLLELDPKLYDLPLIGIWISGVHNVHHPYVWASCLRYLNCREIKDRVLHPSGSFLILHYSILQKIPDFWECFLDNDEKLDFKLLSCQEDLHLDLDDCSSKEPLCFHLIRSPSGMNKTLFDEAVAEWKKDRNSLNRIEQNIDVNQNNNYSKLSGLKNDDNPRPSTSPHPSPTQGTPNAPAPEETLSLSFDEGSNNFDKNHSQRTKENPKNLAPRFKRTLHPTKPVPNNSDSFKISRQPFTQITPPEHSNSPNSLQNRGKPVLASRNQVNRKGENKENTPLTSRYIPQGNITRKPPSKSTDENTFPFCYEKNKKNPRSQSVGNEQQNALSDLNSSNPSLPLTDFGNRKRHHSEGVQSCQVRQPNKLHQTSANSSLALSDDDNLGHISLDSSFTNNHEARRLANKSPTIRNQSNPPHSPERFPTNCQYLPMARSFKHPDRLMDQPLKSDSCNLNHQSPRSDVNSRIQNKAESRQNSPKVSGNVRQTSPRSDNHQISLPTSDKPGQQNLNYMNFQPNNSDINQCKRITSDDKKRQSFVGKSPQPCSRGTVQRSLSDSRKPSPENTDDETSAVYHRVNPHLRQGESRRTSNTSNDMPEEPKGIVTCQLSDNSHQHQTMFAKSGDMTNQRVDIDSQASGRTYGDMVEAAGSKFSDTMQRSPDICSHMKPNNHSPTKHSNQTFPATRRSSAGRAAASHISESDPNAVLANTSSETVNVEVHQRANEQHKEVQQLASNQELEEQVRRQEGMIRILQEQVRSLLKMKEVISSESPLTPMSTPVSTSENGERLTHRSSRDKQENASQVVQRKHEAERVTIGVNTGASLLWEKPQDSCEKCECKRPQIEHIQQDAEDNSEPSEHPDVFPTPEKTESLINLSQVDVPTDSTYSLTPAISNMIIPCMSVDDNSLLSNQAAGTSQAEEESAGGNEVVVKGREFYDKLLGQVKDLLSEQVSTKQEVSKEEVQHTSESDHVPTREIVVKATLKQLEKIKHAEQDGRQQSFTRLQTETSSVFSTHQRSLSTSFLPEHPRLNYVSMSVDDTFDEVTYIDEVALKYLSDEELKQFKSELRPSSGAAVKRSFTRTVRFGSLPSDNERRSLSRRNMHEADFTWNNLSFCTKNYLAKYNLVEGQVSFPAQEEVNTPCKDDSPETSIEPCKPPFPSPAPEGSSHILDIKRLKNLPKLF